MLWHKLIGASTAPSIATFTHNGYSVINTPTLSGGTYTFSGVGLGASGDKVVAVALAGASSSNFCEVTAVTIGGVSATLSFVRIGSRWGAMAWAEVSSSSGDVVITFANTPNSIFMSSIAVFDASGSAPVQTFSNVSTGTGVSPTLSSATTHSGTGVVFALYHAGAVGAGSSAADDTWTGLFEQTSYYLNSRLAQFTDAAEIRAAGTVQVTLSDGSVNAPMLIGGVWK